MIFLSIQNYILPAKKKEIEIWNESEYIVEKGQFQSTARLDSFLKDRVGQVVLNGINSSEKNLKLVYKLERIQRGNVMNSTAYDTINVISQLPPLELRKQQEEVKFSSSGKLSTIYVHGAGVGIPKVTRHQIKWKDCLNPLSLHFRKKKINISPSSLILTFIKKLYFEEIAVGSVKIHRRLLKEILKVKKFLTSKKFYSDINFFMVFVKLWLECDCKLFCYPLATFFVA
ncbi:hypothetical protein RFI_00384, partial [Reticulomyxa filosa]